MLTDKVSGDRKAQHQFDARGSAGTYHYEAASDKSACDSQRRADDAAPFVQADEADAGDVFAWDGHLAFLVNGMRVRGDYDGEHRRFHGSDFGLHAGPIFHL